MTIATSRCVLPCVTLLVLACAFGAGQTLAQKDQPPVAAEEKAVDVHYLEIVTPKVDQTCDVLERAHGVTFGEPVPELGNARTATLSGGGQIGVRAPLRETEEPVVRPYVLVDDIAAAVEKARAAGAEIAIESMEIPGRGTCAIYVLGGIDHGLWEL